MRPTVLALASIAFTGLASAQITNPASQIGSAIQQGNETKLTQLTGGVMAHQLGWSSGKPNFEKITSKALISMVKGCALDRTNEPTAAGGKALLAFRCIGRPAPEAPCNDVGYTITAIPYQQLYVLRVESANFFRSTKRCGRPSPPHPIRPERGR